MILLKNTYSMSNSKYQYESVKVKTHSRPAIDYYRITDNEIDSLCSLWNESSIYLNISIFFFSICLSEILSLITKNYIVSWKGIILAITIATGIIWIILLIIALAKNTNTKALINRIKNISTSKKKWSEEK